MADDTDDKFPGFTDVVPDPKDDPVLVKLAGKGAVAEADEQLSKLNSDALAKVRYELIDQHVSMAMRDGCSRNEAIAYAMERFGIKSPSTVETALAYVKEKAERSPELFKMTPEAEAKAEAFKANEAEFKARAKQRFKRFKAKLRLWLKFR
jgi:hypothetical protein